MTPSEYGVRPPGHTNRSISRQGGHEGLATLDAVAAISRADVAHLAALARISMTDSELDVLAEQLDVILGAVSRVQEVAAADIPPTSHPLPLTNVFRDDTPVPSLPPDDALAAAPLAEDQRFRVPRILDDEE